ncbi:MAG: 23S rRNA (uracil(1939)-C(5))-methyltransferase RlmD [Lachnospiraceae bacterium]|nr:23S rRNA (uracil(1939)-C(5))-methyltransferase RlmD [Lachnospiraceae bacterium]
MKKGQQYEGVVKEINFPNKGIVELEDEVFIQEKGQPTRTERVTARVQVKNAIPGQKVRFVLSKKHKDRMEGRLLEVVEKSPLESMEQCPNYGICGGCLYQGIPYEEELKIKESQIRKLFTPVLGEDGFDAIFEGIKGSPVSREYRNKMEFSFGDCEKGGALTLGMHKRGSFYDVVSVPECTIVDGDFRLILDTTLRFFTEKSVDYYHKMQHVGYLRHLLVRKAARTGEILVDLVTTTQAPANEDELLTEWAESIKALDFVGKLTCLLHTKNDRESDVVEDQGTTILFGQDYFTETLLGLNFRITPFSFFQTNSLGAEVLYDTARDFIVHKKDGSDTGNIKAGSTVYDLYSGTGTIAQVLAPVAGHVIGVEIIEEAVEAAKKNAAENNLTNCDFLAGDVLKVLDDITEKPDFIVLDPPRDGIHPKALPKILSYGVDSMIYISCKPTSLVRDLPYFMEAGYEPKRMCCVDMFPNTANCETIVLLERVSN